MKFEIFRIISDVVWRTETCCNEANNYGALIAEQKVDGVFRWKHFKYVLERRSIQYGNKAAYKRRSIIDAPLALKRLRFLFLKALLKFIVLKRCSVELE
jgi:hypothetical protein